MKALRLLVLGILAFSLFADADPFVGTWKLDQRKSKFTRGDPSLLGGAMQIESVGSALKSTASGANGEGFGSDLTFTCSLDGVPCKVTTSLPMRGSTAVDTITLRRIDDHTIAATGTLNGKPAFSDQRVVSADGNTMTITRAGTTPEGRKYQSTIVLVRAH